MEVGSHVCLKWNNHQSTLVSVFETLLDSGTLVDCTVVAEGRCLKVHRVILSSCSPFFALVFSQHYEKHPIIVLKDVRFQELRAMVDYMYRGEVNISQDQLASLLRAAKSLQIKGLTDDGEKSVGVNTVAGRRRETRTSVQQSGEAAEHSTKPRTALQYLTDTEVVDLSDDSLLSAHTQVETFSSKERGRSLVDCTLETPRSFSPCRDNKMENHCSTTENQLSIVCGGTNVPQVRSKMSPIAIASEPASGNNSLEVPESNTARIECENTLSKATVLIPPPEWTATRVRSPLQQQETLPETPVKNESVVMNTDDNFHSDISHGFTFSDGDCAVPQDQHLHRDGINFLSKGTSIERVVDRTCDIYSGVPKSKRPSFFRCRYCGKVYKYNRNLTKHLKYECGKEPQFRCLYCPARYTQKGTLRKHLERYHQNYDSIK